MSVMRPRVRREAWHRLAGVETASSSPFSELTPRLRRCQGNLSNYAVSPGNYTVTRKNLRDFARASQVSSGLELGYTTRKGQ